MTTFSRVNRLLPAYILHSRKYRDTSLLLDLLTEDHGRVPAVLRGARGGKNNRGTVQPFTPLLVSLSGKAELKTVNKLEAGSLMPLKGESLLVGLYANELLVRLLGSFEALPGLFEAYQTLLRSLASPIEVQSSELKASEIGAGTLQYLRSFEITLLAELGYGIDFEFDASRRDTPIRVDVWYRYTVGKGFYPLSGQLSGQDVFGADILAIAEGDFSSERVQLLAKRIIRPSLASLLGDKPLKSREMFKQYQTILHPEHLHPEEGKPAS